MPNELTVFEHQLEPLKPKFADVLAGRMPPERLIRTVLISCERTPKLLQVNRQSLLNAAMTFGVLALEVDGVTGQGYILPFADRAQACIGYKGMNTLGARSNLTITGACVREGDNFDYELGTSSFLRHKPVPGSKGRIISAWAIATHHSRPPIISVLPIDDILAIKARSPGARKSDSPWNDTNGMAIGFVAMSEKSAKRRLSRSTPLAIESPDFMRAARLEEAFEEQGRLSYIRHDGAVIEEAVSESPLPDRETEQPTAQKLTAPNMDVDPIVEGHRKEGVAAAEKGSAALEAWWHKLPGPVARALKTYLIETLIPMAKKSAQ